MAKLSIKYFSWKGLLALIATILLSIAAGAGIGITINSTEDGDIVIESNFSQIELSETQVPALIETDEGEIEVEVPTVEEVDGNQFATECEEGMDCGRGAYYPTESPTAFRDAIIGKCVYSDSAYGSQCWDLANEFHLNYAGRWLSTCGTGAAKGTLNCWEQNAGDDYVMIWNPEELQAGDIVVFTNGQFGHIGMAMGGYNNGYVALLGTNQGGAACDQGGSAANIINISLKSFGGAFRPKAYIKPEPQPEPVIPISGCIQWHVARGDTMSKIMMECEGTIQYGEIMNEYAKTWYSLIYKPGQSVYDGWHSESGVGLYAGDDIEHRVK